jgi:transcriptional regulator with XRE-family HTH domain
MDIKMTGQFIAELRKSSGLTQQDVARHLGITDKTVSKWECGKGYPDITIIPALAELFHVTSDEILLGERIKKDIEERKPPESRKKQIEYLLKTKRHTINNLLTVSVGCAVAAIVLLYCLGQSTSSVPISCGVSVMLCIISFTIAIIACSKARFVTDDGGISKAFPSEISEFCRSVVRNARLVFTAVMYPVVLNVILWPSAYGMYGSLSEHDLKNPLYSMIAIVIAVLAFFASNKLLLRVLDCDTKRPGRL